MIKREQTMLRWLKTYSEMGFRVTPVAAFDKKPILKNFLKTAESDFVKNKSIFLSSEHRVGNIGLCLAPSGLVAVDVDVKHDGVEKWRRLVEKYGEPNTLSALTGSGGSHYVFLARPGVSYRGNIDDGIDIRFNHQIVVEPSVHPLRTKYRWEKPVVRESVNAYPEWLADLIEKKIVEKRVDLPSLGPGPLAALVDEIEKVSLTYPEWVTVGMALKSELPDAVGLSMFLRATKNFSFKEGNIEDALSKWEGFASNLEGGVGVGSIVHILKEKGVDLSRFRLEQDKQIFRDNEPQFDMTMIPGVTVEGGGLVCRSDTKLVEGINNLGYFYLTEGQGYGLGKVLVDPKTGERDVLLFSEKRLKTDLAPLKYEFLSGERTKRKNADEVWLASRNRRVYKRLRFSPNARPGELNMWTDIALPPIPGDCGRLLEMIFESICNGSEEHARFVVGYLAHLIQKPTEKVFTVPILFSELEGTGKGILCDEIMGKILGKKHFKTLDIGQIDARFNQHLAFRLLTFVDEVSMVDGKKTLSKVKSIVGSKTLNVEYKMGATVTVENYSRYMMATNLEAPIPIQHGNRRFVFIESSKKCANKSDYFAPIIDGLKNGNLANHFLHYLQEFDLVDFDPNRMPTQHNMGIVARLKSSGSVGEFWHHLFFESPEKVFARDRGLIGAEAYEKYRNFAQRSHVESPKGFLDRTKKVIPCLRHEPNRQHRLSATEDEKFRAYRVTPVECLDSFCAYFQIDPPKDFEAEDYYSAQHAAPVRPVRLVPSMAMEDF